jgi:hypothetical protein
MNGVKKSLTYEKAKRAKTDTLKSTTPALPYANESPTIPLLILLNN